MSKNESKLSKIKSVRLSKYTRKAMKDLSITCNKNQNAICRAILDSACKLIQINNYSYTEPLKFRIVGNEKNKELQLTDEDREASSPLSLRFSEYSLSVIEKLIAKNSSFSESNLISTFLQAGFLAIQENNGEMPFILNFELDRFAPTYLKKQNETEYPNLKKDPNHQEEEKIDWVLPNKDGSYTFPEDSDVREGDVVESKKTEEDELDFDSLNEDEKEMYEVWLDGDEFGEILDDIEEFSEFKERYGDHWEECQKILGGRRYAIQKHVLRGAVSWHNAHLIYFDISCLGRDPKVVSLKYNIHPDLIDEFVNEKPNIKFWNQWTDEDNFEFRLGANIEALIAFFNFSFGLGIDEIISKLDLSESEVLPALQRIKKLDTIENEKIKRKIRRMEKSIMSYFEE